MISKPLSNARPCDIGVLYDVALTKMSKVSPSSQLALLTPLIARGGNRLKGHRGGVFIDAQRFV
jgi:hypothetical protein